MNCPQFDEALLDAARGEPATPALRAHLAVCERCSSSLRQQENLTRGLRALGGGLDIEPAPGLEARLMAAFHEEVGVETRTPWRAMLGAAAAVLLVVASLVVASRDFERSRAQSRMVAAEAEFVPWPGVAALPQFESGQLVRTELPASVLPLLGIEPASGVTSEIVMADVLIGQDGLARAVRLAK